MRSQNKSMTQKKLIRNWGMDEGRIRWCAHLIVDNSEKKTELKRETAVNDNIDNIMFKTVIWIYTISTLFLRFTRSSLLLINIFWVFPGNEISESE